MTTKRLQSLRMGATAKQSRGADENELLLGRDLGQQQVDFVENKGNSRAARLLGVVLTIFGLLLVTILVIILNSQSTAKPSIRNLHKGARRLIAKEPISLREVLTGELNGNPFESTWLTDSQTGRDQLLFPYSGDLYLTTLDDNHESLTSTGNNLPPEVLYDKSLVSARERIAASFHGKHNHHPLLDLPSVKISLASNPRLNSIDYETWKLSPSRRFLLLAANQRQRFRGSFTADYFIYDTKLDSIRKLKTQASDKIATGSRDYFGEQLEWPGERSVRFQVADWFSGPNGDDSLLLVQDGDLYVLKDIAGRTSSNAQDNDDQWWPERLTFTGQPGTIYNGLTDWSYEEQLTAGKPAYAISPLGSQYLAYFSFNDSQVSETPMVLLDDNRVRPDNVRLRFPTAGTPIASVRLHMIENFASASDGTSAREVPIVLPEELASQQHFLFFANWLTNDKLSVVWLNRPRSKSHVLICSRQMPVAQDSTGAWICDRSSSAIAPTNGWLEMIRAAVKLNDEFYLMLMPKFEGAEVGEFTHVARISLRRPSELLFLTSGRKEVFEVAGVDLERSLLYYSATGIGQPGERHLYVTSLQLPGKSGRANNNHQPDTCLTCDLYPGEHLYFEAELSNAASHFVLHCKGPDVPRIELRELVHAQGMWSSGAHDKISSRLVRTIEDNRQVRDKVARVKAMPEEVRLRLPIKNTDYDASVLLLLPPLAEFEHNTTSAATTFNIDEHISDGAEQIRSYVERMHAIDSELGITRDAPPFPMIVDVYGGPAPFVKTGQERNITWGHWYASSRRTVYAWIEGRGSGLEGTRRLFEMFGRLGTVEIEDQIQVTRNLVQGLLAPLVHPAKVGIWGWSYGGYAAGMVLARDGAQAKHASPPGPGVFACGGSFGAVTDWLYYDTLFAEMILRSPWINEQYDRRTLGDHLLTETGSNNQSLAIDETRIVRPASLIDDVNDRYRNSSLIEQIEHIRGKRYLLVSGLADDNVHIQHTLRLTKRLIAKGIPFEMAFYPNQRHSMNYNLATRTHMHKRLANFFTRCFDSKLESKQIS